VNLKPPIKLFGWKRAILPLSAGVAIVAFRLYQSYEKKGRLDGVDVGVSIVTLAMLFGIMAAVAWWANKPD